MSDDTTGSATPAPDAPFDPGSAEAGRGESEIDRVEARAHLLPEEVAAGGSADPELQALIILEDSDRRTEQPETARHESAQTPDR